jgi:hypothetical protein
MSLLVLSNETVTIPERAVTVSQSQRRAICHDFELLDLSLVARDKVSCCSRAAIPVCNEHVRACREPTLAPLLEYFVGPRRGAPGGTVRPNALAGLRMIILSAGKESFPRDRCRRSIGSGFRCRADGPRRKERTSDQ